MADTFVLDTSALLCLLKGQPGAERILTALPRASISALNVSDVYALLAQAGGSEARIAQAIDGLHLRIIPFDEAQARATGMLHAATKSHELSLGDCACLTLARQSKAVALTTERAWSALSDGLGVTIEVIG